LGVAGVAVGCVFFVGALRGAEEALFPFSLAVAELDGPSEWSMCFHYFFVFGFVLLGQMEVGWAIFGYWVVICGYAQWILFGVAVMVMVVAIAVIVIFAVSSSVPFCFLGLLLV
jgi:hypothetical protein